MDNLRGIVAGKWLRLLRENNFAIDRGYRGRAWAVTVMSLRNTLAARQETVRFGEASAQAQVQPPIFILGHWRSGTTLLHELLVLDQQFAYANAFQVTNPFTFLNWEEKVRAYYQQHAETQTRPQDNVEISFDSPGEDEAALAVASLRSPMLGWTFPKREAHYDRYYTFADVPASEIAEWKAAVVWFLKKLSWRYNKPLVLKSPTHTGRIRLLLDLFPDARFIHIYRNPYDVFRSTQQLYAKAVPFSHLQQPASNQVDEGIIRRYSEMHQAFFAQQPLIPASNFCEVRFEELERDIPGQLALVYQQLGLDGYPTLRPKLEQYMAAKANYQKNRHTSLPEPVRNRLAQAWQRSFETWGYSYDN